MNNYHTAFNLGKCIFHLIGSLTNGFYGFIKIMSHWQSDLLKSMLVA